MTLPSTSPMTFDDLDDWEGLNFDLIITLSPEAHHKALELTRTMAVDVEYWPTHDPTDTEGNREQKLDGLSRGLRRAGAADPQAISRAAVPRADKNSRDVRGCRASAPSDRFRANFKE